MTTRIESIDEGVAQEDLEGRGLSIENIVGTLELGHEYDLVELNDYLDDSSYEPETSPFLVYRPQKKPGTVLIPTNGKVSFVGCKNKEQLMKISNHLVETLSQITVGELPSPTEVEVQNIVVQGSINHELDLPPIVVLLGIEEAEYEPEQFPGVIYRPKNGITILIFGSGKFMANGATSYSQAVSAVDDLIEKFREGGVPMDI